MTKTLSIPARITIVSLSFIGSAACMTTGWNGERGQPTELVEYQEAGSVTVDMRIWNIFFAKTPAERRRELILEAERRAIAEYGEGALIANHSIDSRWSPYSLFLSLDLIGFVERGVLIADVLVPRPPPPPPPPQEPITLPKAELIVKTSYPVNPIERFTDAFGYIGLEYLTKGEAEDRAKARLSRRGVGPDELEKVLAKIPDGGHLLVHIGRQDLLHANTLLYSYIVMSGDKMIISRKGRDGIPNIKGRDGNWWNVVTIPLDNPIDESISVRITDTKIEKTYEFSVDRTEQVM